MNWKPWAALGLMLALVIPASLALFAPLEDSLVVDGQEAGSLISIAKKDGWDIQRTSGGPMALTADSDLDASATVLLVLAPERPYDEADQEALKQFVDEGGTTLVFDAFGQSATLTRFFGIDMERVRLVEKNSDATIFAQTGPSQWEVSLGNPTALRISESFEGIVHAWSSSEAFLDRDGDGIISRSEPRGPFPIIAETQTGEGRLIVVADESLVHGSNAAENTEWRKALLDNIAPQGGGLLLVDESKMESIGPAGAAVGNLVRFAGSAPWNYLLGAVGLVGIIAMFLPVNEYFWRRHQFRPNRFIRRADLVQELGDDKSEKIRTTQWSLRGTVAILVAIITLCGGVIFGNSQATMVAMLLLGALAVAMIPRSVSLLAYREVRLGEVSEGTEVPVRLVLDARSGSRIQLMDKVTDDVEIVEGHNWVNVGGKRGRVEVSYKVNPPLSGPHDLGPLVARADDPLRLRYQQRSILEPFRLRVRPRDQDVRKLPHNTKLSALIMGLHVVNKAGDGTEFHALRDFQSGDSYRMVNWKASARTKGLVVNQRVHESMAHLTIIVDARAISGAGPVAMTPVAQCRRVAISLVSGALRGRDRVQLYTYGNGVQQAPEAPGMRQLHLANQYLGDLTPAGETSAIEAVNEIIGSLRPRSPVLLIGGFEGDDSCLDAVKLLRSRNIDPVVIACALATEPTDSEDGGPEPGGEKIRQERSELVQNLRSMGVRLFEADGKTPLDYLFRVGGD